MCTVRAKKSMEVGVSFREIHIDKEADLESLQITARPRAGLGEVARMCINEELRNGARLSQNFCHGRRGQEQDHDG